LRRDKHSFCLFVFPLLGIKPGILCMLSKCSTLSYTKPKTWQ
jgi:hypothetical protein